MAPPPQQPVPAVVTAATRAKTLFLAPPTINLFGNYTANERWVPITSWQVSA